MPNWEQWLDDNSRKNVSKKPNKNFYCRKHKLGNKQYGPHEYKDNDSICTRCGHIKNKTSKINELKESENKHEQRDE